MHVLSGVPKAKENLHVFLDRTEDTAFILMGHQGESSLNDGQGSLSVATVSKYL